jgi:hypothetical protein
MSVAIDRYACVLSPTDMDASLRWHDGYFLSAACAAASRAIGTR